MTTYTDQDIHTLREENQALRWIQSMSEVLLFVKNELELWFQFRDMLIQIGRVQAGVYLTKDEFNGWRVDDVFGSLNSFSDDIREQVPHFIASMIPQRSSSSCFHHIDRNDEHIPSVLQQSQGTQSDMIVYAVSDGEQCISSLILYSENENGLQGEVIPSLLQTFHLTLRIIRQREQLHRLSMQDLLTGIANRRGLEQHLIRLFASKRRLPAVFVLFDMNKFKHLNDTQGHQMGDAALCDAGQYFSKKVGNNGIVARLGGDEFVLVLEHESWNEALENKLNQWIAEAPLSKYGLGLSGGVVDIPTEANDFNQAYRIADRRLYVGKQQHIQLVRSFEGE